MKTIIQKGNLAFMLHIFGLIESLANYLSVKQKKEINSIMRNTLTKDEQLKNNYKRIERKILCKRINNCC